MPKDNTYLVELSDEDISIIEYALGALTALDLIADIIAECEEDMASEAEGIHRTFEIINNRLKEQRNANR